MKLAELIKQDNFDLDTVEIQYGVIYSADSEEINECDSPPEAQSELWDNTEDDDESDYGIEGWSHKKWCALLNQEQFDEFVNHVCIHAQDIETMGSLGAPSPDGICLGCSPAISFDNDDYDGIYNAYVTPYVMGDFDHPFDEDDWQALRKAIIRKYQ
jgi:hypothetical protein